MVSDAKEQIKERLDVVEVIREYIQLKAVGSNFQARCPFHQEKTPSFNVSPSRQIWKCFGCGKGGDVFSFVMEMEGLSFPEALRQLAPKAGVELTQRNPREASQRNRLLDIMEHTAGYYHRVLVESQAAAPIRDYLHERGLTDETIDAFRVGYAPESWDDVLNGLRKRGFADRDSILAGVAIHKPETGKTFNRFRGRIMFPIADHNGNVVAFTARVSPQREATETMGKYINSPQTPLYDKSRILFGLDRSKQAIRTADQAVVVEGQMDAISSHQAGVTNVVASSGTALSVEQLKLLKRYTRNVALAFDMDAAGQAAARRGIEQALAEDMDITVISVPGGKDPDECIRENPGEWQRAIEGAQGIMEYIFDQVFREVDVRNVAQKKRAAATVLGIVRHIANPIERDAWIRELSERIGSSEAALREVLRRVAGSAQSRVAPKQPPAPEPTVLPGAQLDRATQSLFALAMRFPAYFPTIFGQLEPVALPDETARRFYKKLILYYNGHIRESGIFDAAHFVEWLPLHVENEADVAAFEDIAQRALITGDRDFDGVGEIEAKEVLQRVLRDLQRRYLTDQSRSLEQELRAAERERDTGRIQALMAQLSDTARKMSQLSPAE